MTPAALMQASRQALSAAITRKAAASKPISLVSLSDEQIEQTGAARQTIPAGTYAGIDEDVSTTSLPVIAYTTSAMDDDTAYTLTRSEEHTSELQSRPHLVCRLLLEKKK